MTITKVLQTMAALRNVDSDDLLGRMGLERRHSSLERFLTIAGVFGAGMIMGAGVGLLASQLAPNDVRKRIAEGARSVKDTVSSAKDELSEFMSSDDSGQSRAGRSNSSSHTSSAGSSASSSNSPKNGAVL